MYESINQSIGRSFGFSRDSRETTLLNGRKRIQEVASRLRLNAHFVECAARMFTVAVEKNFVQGRRTTHVVAACLYMACRMENSQHMLIDFSDALQVNVYTLGTCFLKFRRLLGCPLAIIDPALYIYRFAAHLDLGEKANAVGLTALRIVSRMKRDWIVSGRRPAGICAAALLIASRAHGFSRSQQDVTKVLRVCGMTVLNRVKEFEYTPSSSLTLEQFHEMEIETEADPPSYTKNRLREARAKALQENNVPLLTSGALDDPRDGSRKQKWREQSKQSERKAQMAEMYDSIEAEVRGEIRKNRTSQQQSNEEEESKEENQLALVEANNSTNQQPSKEIAHIPYPKAPNGKTLILPSEAHPSELVPAQPTIEKIDLQDWKTSMPEDSQKEMEYLFRNDEEVAQKEAIFNSLHQEYLRKMEQQEEDRKFQEKNEKEIEKEEDVTEKQAKAFQKKRRQNWSAEDDPSTEDLLRATVSSRKISRKINYEAMGSIFDEDGGFSMDLLEDREGPGLEAGVFKDV